MEEDDVTFFGCLLIGLVALGTLVFWSFIGWLLYLLVTWIISQ